MVPKISAQLLSQSLLSGTLAILSIGNAIASEIPTVQVSAVDRQSDLLEESTDDSIAKIGGIYPINTLLNPDSAPATSNLALARRKKRINTKPQIKRGGSNTQPQIQNTPVNTSPQIQNTPINTPPQVQNTPINTQPQVQNPPINTPPPMPSGLSATQNQIQYKRNDFGVAAQFGNSTSFGIQSKVGVSDNISIRPEVFFSSGTSLESPKDTALANFVTFANNADNSFTLPSTITINENFTTPVQFTTTAPVSFNRDIIRDGIVVIPAATILPVGSIVPAGDIIPAGSILPAGFALPGGITIPNGTAASGFAKAKTTGTSFGMAVTYDFKLDPGGKSTAYLGPKVAFSSASGPFNVGASVPGATVNTNETKIGLTAGLDYAVSDGFTIGANATYNFSRSVSGTASFNGQSSNIDNVLKPVGNALDFGLRLGFQF